MTGSALRAKAARVSIIAQMAGRTISGRLFEQIILMTIRAGGGSMFAIQLEGKFRVINFGGLPAIWRMTGGTTCSKLTGMSIFL